MSIPWNDDAALDRSRIRRNVRGVLGEVVRHAKAREVPTVAMVQAWHRGIYDGCPLPVAYYAGEIRDSDARFPELFGYEVMVGGQLAVLSSAVPGELAVFETRVQTVVPQLDAAIPAGKSALTVPELRSVVELAANVHGEWVRIHPFANGNGRAGRLWANWALVRYGLPTVVRTKPRPAGDAYALAARESMLGDHTVMVAVINRLVQSRLRGP